MKVLSVLLGRVHPGRIGLNSPSVLFHVAVDRCQELGLVEMDPTAREMILKVRRVMNRNAHHGQPGLHMVNVQSHVVPATSLDRESVITEMIALDP